MGWFWKLSFLVLICAVTLSVLITTKVVKIPDHLKMKNLQHFKPARTSVARKLAELCEQHNISPEWIEELTGIDEYGRLTDEQVKKRNYALSAEIKKRSDEIFNGKSKTISLKPCASVTFDVGMLRRFKHISLLGHVFDVSIMPEMYGVRGGYEEFTGHEGTMHYIFGMSYHPVTATKNDPLHGLSLASLDELMNWFEFYLIKYDCIGFIPGDYMEIDGKPNKYLLDLVGNFVKMRTDRQKLKEEFPQCEEKMENGERIQSCGQLKTDNGKVVQLLPRQLLEPGHQLARCTCTTEEQRSHPRVRPFVSCNPDEPVCVYTVRNQNETDWSGVERLVPKQLNL